MTTFEDMMATTELPTVRPRRRRIRGLRMPVLPAGTLLAQIGGGGVALSGVYGAWGWHVAAMVGGVVAVVLGALREAGKI